MAVSETTPARRAALLLHSLPPDLQGQVLARLGEAVSARLQPLLDELMELGIPPALGERVGDSISAPAAPALSTAQRRAAELDAAVVAACLEECSPMTVAQLFRAHAWPWKQAVLCSLNQPRRRQVAQYMQEAGPVLPPGVLQSLCRQLCRQAEALSRRKQTVTTPISSSGIGARLGKWVRWIR